MRLLAVASVTDGTGNAISIQRLISLLSRLHPTLTSVVLNCDTLTNAELENVILEDSSISIVLAMHAYRAGKFLLTNAMKNLPKSCKKVVVLSGTDMNRDSGVLELKTIMGKVFDESTHIVAFNHHLAEKCKSLYGIDNEKLHCIPQSVLVPAVNSSISLFQHLDISLDSKIILLPAGIRPVKDIFFLVKAASNLHCRNSLVVFVICGPVLDREYAKDLFQQLQLDYRNGSAMDMLIASTKIQETVQTAYRSTLFPGVYYQSPVDRSVLLHWMQQSFIVTNSSHSEGQSNALSEAMLMKTIVVARDNQGNKDLISNKKDGFLFNTSNEWETICESLIEASEGARQSIIENAYVKIRSYEAFENDTWKTLLG
jgi:glycosyltransferase involved in cell wall biosynthesis